MRSSEEIQALYEHHQRQLEAARAVSEQIEAGEVHLSKREEESLYSDQDTLAVETATLAWILNRASTPAFAITENVEEYTQAGQE
jgi:hypothetical protein